MDISDFVSSVKDSTSEELERKFNKLVRENFRFKNLDEKNKKIILDLVKKYRNDYLREGRPVPLHTLERDMHNLYGNRIKLGITDEDLKDIKEIMAEFR